MKVYRYRMHGIPLYSLRRGVFVGARRRYDGYIARGLDHAVGIGDTPQEAILNMRQEYVDSHKGRQAIEDRKAAQRFAKLFAED